LVKAAGKNGGPELVELLLNHGADITKTGGYRKQTALHKAVWHYNTEIARLLLAKGADVNAKDKEDRTPLHLVPTDEGIEIAELLIANRADVNAEDEDKETPLYTAVCYENYALAKLLIDNGANVNVKNKDGLTPLFLAWCYDNLEIMKLLLDHGAVNDMQSDIDNPPFAMAIKSRLAVYDETEKTEFAAALNELRSHTP
jgi:cytohesin